MCEGCETARASKRRATWERNPPGMRFAYTVRKYGQGVATFGEGVANSFSDRKAAQACARRWAEEGR